MKRPAETVTLDSKSEHACKPSKSQVKDAPHIASVCFSKNFQLTEIRENILMGTMSSS